MRTYVALLTGLALLGLGCALGYASWNPTLGPYSRRYFVGALAPLAMLAGWQVALVLRPPPLRPRRLPAALVGALVAASAVLGVAWAARLPEPRSAVFVVVWLPGLALLALFRVTRRHELLLAGLGPLGIAVSVFAGELPRLAVRHPPLNWGTPATFAYLHPARAPFFGVGGRLRPNLRARLASAEHAGGAAIRTTAEGFRADGPVPRTPAPGEYRVLSLGDSFACGYGAAQDEFFGARLERELDARLAGARARVLSAEVSDPAYGLLYLQTHGPTYAPRVVVYGLSGNDVLQVAQLVGPRRRFRLRGDGRLEPNPAFAHGDDVIAELQAWAYPSACPPASLARLQRGELTSPRVDWAARLASLRVLGHLVRLLPPRPAVMPSQATAYSAIDGRLRLIDGYANLGHFYRRDAERVRALNGALFPLLRGLRQETRRLGARFVLVLFPQRFQVAPADWDVLCRFWGLSAHDFDLELLNRQVAEFCQAEGLECLDLLGSFRQAAPRQGLYLPGGDMHFNRHGHRLAAAATAAYVVDGVTAAAPTSVWPRSRRPRSCTFPRSASATSRLERGARGGLEPRVRGPLVPAGKAQRLRQEPGLEYRVDVEEDLRAEFIRPRPWPPGRGAAAAQRVAHASRSGQAQLPVRPC